MHERDRIAKHKPIGPFAPPTPSEADGDGPEPMAVANDKANLHGESFVATSAPRDQYSDDVARRYRQVPGAALRAHTNAESRAAEHPDGYSEPDERGWAKPAERDE